MTIRQPLRYNLSPAEGWMSGERRQFWIILATVFWNCFAFSMSYLIFPSLFLSASSPLLPPEASDATRSLYLGMSLAIYPLGQLVGSPFLGSLSDTYGHKRILSLSLVMAALSHLGTALSISSGRLGFLIVSQLCAGFTEGNYAIARAMAADIKTMPKEKSLGRVDAAYSGAYILGPLLGALLSRKHTAIPFYTSSCLFLLLALLATILLCPARPMRGHLQRPSLFQRTKALLAHRELKVLLSAVTLFTLAVDLYYEFGPVHLTMEWMCKPSQLIWYNALLSIGLVIGSGWLSPILSAKAPERLLIFAGFIGFGLLMIPIAFTRSLLLMLFLFGLSGIAIGLAVTLLTVKISNCVSADVQGEVMGIQQSLRVLGDAIICLVGGGLLILSSKFILVAAAAVTLPAFIYYERSRTRARYPVS